MRKFIFTLGLLAGAFTFAFAQFSELGYKDLKLGTPIEDTQKLAKIKIEEDVFAKYGTTNYNGIDLDLSFAEMDGENEVLYLVSSTDTGARIEGVNKQIIGKSYNEVKAILGDKMEHYMSYGDSDLYYYYRNKELKGESMTLCMLEFDETNDALVRITAFYAP